MHDFNDSESPKLSEAEGPLISIGGPINNSCVTFRMYGDDLEPDIVSALLGCNPTSSRKKGDIILKGTFQRVARTGSWCLEGDDARNVALELQIDNLLNRMTSDLQVWSELSNMYDIDLFCGVFLSAWSLGFELSPALLKRIADRGMKIGFDIYGHSPADERITEAFSNDATVRIP